MKPNHPACCSCGTSLKYRRAYTLKENQGPFEITKYYCLQCYPKAKKEKEGE